MEEPAEEHQQEEPEETEPGAETPPGNPWASRSSRRSWRSRRRSPYRSLKIKNVPQVSLRRERSEEKTSIEAKRWEQEKLDRRSRSPE